MLQCLLILSSKTSQTPYHSPLVLPGIPISKNLLVALNTNHAERFTACSLKCWELSSRTTGCGFQRIVGRTDIHYRRWDSFITAGPFSFCFHWTSLSFAPSQVEIFLPHPLAIKDGVRVPSSLSYAAQIILSLHLNSLALGQKITQQGKREGVEEGSSCHTCLTSSMPRTHVKSWMQWCAPLIPAFLLWDRRQRQENQLETHAWASLEYSSWQQKGQERLCLDKVKDQNKLRKFVL